MEFVLHFMYVVAIKDTGSWGGDSPAELSMVGFWNLIVVWLKVSHHLSFSCSRAGVQQLSLKSCSFSSLGGSSDYGPWPTGWTHLRTWSAVWQTTIPAMDSGAVGIVATTFGWFGKPGFLAMTAVELTVRHCTLLQLHLRPSRRSKKRRASDSLGIHLRSPVARFVVPPPHMGMVSELVHPARTRSEQNGTGKQS
jgi:hypothetical protein